MQEIGTIKMIEAVSRAVETKKEGDVRAAESLVRTLCARRKQSWLLFIFDNVLPMMEVATKGVLEVREIECPYCQKPVKNIVGLKAHLGVKHSDIKEKWSGKY